MTRKAKILIVEDELILAMSMEKELARRGYQVCESVSSGDEALEKVKEEQPEIILLDCCLGSVTSGFEAATRIRLVSDIPIVFMSGLNQEDIADTINAIGGSAFLGKPFDPDALIRVIESSLATYHKQSL